jgi:iron(III) transport system permease protein
LMMAYLIRFLSPAYSALHSGYQRIPREADMVAQSLGKSGRQILWQIHLPMLRLPIVTAALVVAIDVLKELPATLILRPFDVKTLALAVYEFASDDRPVEAAPYALMMIAMGAFAVMMLHRLQERSHGAA